MVLSEYAKIRILTLWRENSGPTVIVKALNPVGSAIKDTAQLPASLDPVVHPN